MLPDYLPFSEVICYCGHGCCTPYDSLDVDFFWCYDCECHIPSEYEWDDFLGPDELWGD